MVNGEVRMTRCLEAADSIWRSVWLKNAIKQGGGKGILNGDQATAVAMIAVALFEHNTENNNDT